MDQFQKFTRCLEERSCCVGSTYQKEEAPKATSIFIWTWGWTEVFSMPPLVAEEIQNTQLKNNKGNIIEY